MPFTFWCRIIGALTAWAFAAYIYSVARHDRVVRRLCVLLLVEGFVLINGLFGSFTRGTALESEWWAHLHFASDWLLVALYPPFLGTSLPTRFTQFFRTRAGEYTCAAVAAAGLLTIILFPRAYSSASGWGALTYTLFAVVSLTFAYGLAAAIIYWRSASGLAREQARAFMVAFGLRDLVWFSVYGVALMAATQPELSSKLQSYFTGPAYGLVVVLYVPLLAYGILKLHLFDIELRVKSVIHNSTIGAAFLAVFFIVSQSSAAFLSQRFGNALGLMIAAALMLVLRPLERFASSVADAALPNAHRTAEYEIFKKLQIYHAALEAAYERGNPSPKSLTLLKELRTSLDISGVDAERLETDVRAAATTGVFTPISEWTL